MTDYLSSKLLVFVVMHFQTPLDMQGWESPIRSRQFHGMEFATHHQSDQNHKLLPATKKSLVKFLWLESPCNGKQISQHLTLPARVIQWEQKILDLNRDLCFLLRGLVVIQYLDSFKYLLSKTQNISKIYHYDLWKEVLHLHVCTKNTDVAKRSCIHAALLTNLGTQETQRLTCLQQIAASIFMILSQIKACFFINFPSCFVGSITS